MGSVVIGTAVGLAAKFVISLLTPKPKDDGGDIDNSTQKSEYGFPISKPYGNFRFNGFNIFWAPPLRIQKTKQGKGGGGGGEKTEVFGTFACGFLDGLIIRYRRIWLNGRIVYNNDGVTETFDPIITDKLHLFLGSDTQLKSSVIVGVEGSDIPAFTNRAYVVFDDINLKEFSNRLPKVDIEVIQASSPTVASVVEDIINRADLPSGNLNIEGAGTLIGFQIKQNGETYKSVLEDLQKTFFLIYSSSNGKINILKQERPDSPSIINTEDMGVGSTESDPKDLFIEKRLRQTDLATYIQINYKNFDNDFNPGNQIAQIITDSPHINEINYTTDVVFQDGTVNVIAKTTLYQNYFQRRRFDEIELLPYYLFLEPGGLIQFDSRNQTIVAQIEKLDIGADYSIKLDSIFYFNAAFDYGATSGINPGYTETETVFTPGDGVPIQVDLPRIDDTEPEIGAYTGITLAVAGSDWDIGLYYASKTSGGDEFIYETPNLLSYGETTQTLGEASQFAIDTTHTFEVVLTTGVLNTITEAEFLSYGNVALVGDEIIAFRDATLTAPNTYDVSYLLRGLWGTEAEIDNHTATDRFLVLSDNLPVRVELTTGDFGSTYFLKAVHENKDPIAASEFTSNFTGNCVQPFPPVLPKLVGTTGALIIRWTRRNRTNAQWNDLVDVPMTEAEELYDLEIRNGVTIVRTLTGLISPEYTYTDADQITDFGSTQTQLDFTVYQISALVNRGKPLVADNIIITEYE